MLSPAGAIAARYDKIHLFDIDLGEGRSYRESATIAAGRNAVIAPRTQQISGMADFELITWLVIQ